MQKVYVRLGCFFLGAYLRNVYLLLMKEHLTDSACGVMVPTMMAMFSVRLPAFDFEKLFTIYPCDSFLGISLKPLDQSIGKAAPANLLLNANCGKLQLCTSRKPLVVQAGYRYFLSNYFVIQNLYVLIHNHSMLVMV